MTKYFVLLCAAVAAFALPVMAAEAPADQNAFTRMMKEPLAGILTPVENPKVRSCNSVVDCRQKGRDLSTVWQVNTKGAEKPVQEYPQRCHVMGKDGKYVYSAKTCH